MLCQGFRKTESGGRFTGPLGQMKSSQKLYKGQVLKHPESQSKAEKTHCQEFGVRVFFFTRVVYDWIQIKSTKAEGIVPFCLKKKKRAELL